MIAALLLASLVSSVSVQRVGTGLDCGLGYEGLLAQMAAKPGATAMPVQQGQPFGVYKVESERAIYTFTIEGQAAHPAIVQRRVQAPSGKVMIATSACGYGNPRAFQQLIIEMDGLNAKVGERVRR